jgi:hypothetical protein
LREVPSLDGLNWSQVRTLARQLAGAEATDEVVEIAVANVADPDHCRRMLATYLLGFAASRNPANLEILHDRIVGDPSWEVQEALGQAFDAWCSAVGYEAALVTIDRWLADRHPNARRAVSEGLRPWTSKSRPYFAHHPLEAIRRLVALRADPSEYVRHSAGNALRDIRRSHPALVDAETATWDLANPRVAFTYARVEKVR